MFLVVEYLADRALLALSGFEVEDETLLGALAAQFQVWRCVGRVHGARSDNGLVFDLFLHLGDLLAHPFLVLVGSLHPVLPVASIQVVDEDADILLAAFRLDCVLHGL